MKADLIIQIKNWINTLTPDDFEKITAPLISGLNTFENIKIAKEVEKKTGLKVISDNDIKIGDYFIVDSRYHKNGDLCIVQRIKGKSKTVRHHKIIEVLAPKSQFNNFCWGYFAIPSFNYF